MIFNDFAKFSLKNPTVDVMDLYNQFIMKSSAKEQKFIAANCMLLLKIGKAARDAPESVKEMLS